MLGISVRQCQRYGTRRRASFLTDILANGPVATTEIEDAANGNAISKRTLERAKRELGITAEKDGQWYWRLPDTAKAKVASD
jgi:hypothetical protein